METEGLLDMESTAVEDGYMEGSSSTGRCEMVMGVGQLYNSSARAPRSQRSGRYRPQRCDGPAWQVRPSLQPGGCRVAGLLVIRAKGEPYRHQPLATAA